MKPKQLERITKEPTHMEKCKSAAQVSLYASIGGVVVLASGYLMKYGVGRDATDKAAMKVAILLMFLSAVCLGSGVYALKGLSDQKRRIIAMMLVSFATMIVFLATTFG
jgi:high-affinity Fe2+/Pb2+ permease